MKCNGPIPMWTRTLCCHHWHYMHPISGIVGSLKKNKKLNLSFLGKGCDFRFLAVCFIQLDAAEIVRKFGWILPIPEGRRHRLNSCNCQLRKNTDVFKCAGKYRHFSSLLSAYISNLYRLGKISLFTCFKPESNSPILQRNFFNCRHFF